MSDSKITLEKTDDLVSINLGTEISAAHVQELYNLISEGFSTYLPIEFDASQLNHIDATSIQTIIAAKRKASDSNIKIILKNPRAEVCDLFELLGLSEQLTEMLEK